MSAGGSIEGRRATAREWRHGDLLALSCTAVLAEVASTVVLRPVAGLGRDLGGAVLVVGTVLLVARRRGLAPAALGLVVPRRRSLLLALAVAMAAIGAQVGLGLALGARVAIGMPPWAALLDAGVVAPIEEEILFRGVVYAGLRARWGGVVAAAVSAVVFGAIHIPAVIVPTVLGVVLAALLSRTGSLWPGVLVHVLNNALALAAGTPTPPDAAP